MQDDALRTSIVAVDSAELDVLLEEMDAALNEANALVAQLQVNGPDELSGLGYRQLKQFEQSLRRAYTRTEDARKTFKREWEKPMKRVEDAFKAETAAIKALLDIYKGERVARDEAEKGARFAHLRDVYADFCIGNGLSALMDNVPFERIIDGEKWLNKSEDMARCEQELIGKVSGILADWRSVQQTPYRFPEEAARCFFRSLSLAEVEENDARLAREDNARRALEAEVAGNRADAAGVTEAPVERTYVIRARMDDGQFAQFLAFFRSMGIHGTWHVEE